MRFITIEQLYQIWNLHPEATCIRAFACDVVELRLMSGTSITPEPNQTRLCGINQDSENGLLRINRFRKDESELADDDDQVQTLMGNIHPNGIFELHDRFYAGGLSIKEGVNISEAVRDGNIGDNYIYAAALHKSGDMSVYAKTWKADPVWIDGNSLRTHHHGGDALEFVEHALSTTDCIHAFRPRGSTGWKHEMVIYEECMFCGAQNERKATPEEIEDNSMSWESISDLHRISHEFIKTVDVIKNRKGASRYDLMEMAEEFANCYPEAVRCVRVDDEAHATSLLVLIDHETEKEYWGTSVFYIPQTMGDPQNFFLYPRHRKALEQAIGAINCRDSRTTEDAT